MFLFTSVELLHLSFPFLYSLLLLLFLCILAEGPSAERNGSKSSRVQIGKTFHNTI
jgi:hypothetical protein